MGYKYAFVTTGTDVKINFELLDAKDGVVAYLWKQSPFTETQMTNVSGKEFTKTINSQISGTTISYACKFAYAGGLSVTKYFSYVVGNSCSLGIDTQTKPKQFFFPNPVQNVLHLELLDAQNKISVTDILGRTLVQDTVPAAHNIDMSAFKTGIYFLRVENTFGTQNLKIIKN